MKRRRISTDEYDDENLQQNDTDSQQDEGPPPKRIRLTPPTPPSTNINHLPIEMLERILVSAVLTSVDSLRLAKQAWKDKANLLIREMGTVCERWNSVVCADMFSRMIQSALDKKPEMTVRIEILNQMASPSSAYMMTAMNDEVYVLNGPCGQGYQVGIYDRNNMAHEKLSITIPVDSIWEFTACSRTDSVYILAEELSEHPAKHSVLQLKIKKNQDFDLSSFITGMSLIQPQMTVCANHSIIIASGPHEPDLHQVYLYDAYGSLKDTTSFTETNIGCSHVQRVFMNRHRSLVVVSLAEEPTKVKLTKLHPTTGQIQHQNLTSIMSPAETYFIDIHDRLLVCDESGSFEMFDCELNRIMSVAPLPQLTGFSFPSRVRYNYERNEIVRVPENLFEDPNEQMAFYRFVEQ